MVAQHRHVSIRTSFSGLTKLSYVVLYNWRFRCCLQDQGVTGASLLEIQKYHESNPQFFLQLLVRISYRYSAECQCQHLYRSLPLPRRTSACTKLDMRWQSGTNLASYRPSTAAHTVSQIAESERKVGVCLVCSLVVWCSHSTARALPLCGWTKGLDGRDCECGRRGGGGQREAR
jgi:hypothetical protein